MPDTWASKSLVPSAHERFPEGEAGHFGSEEPTPEPGGCVEGQLRGLLGHRPPEASHRHLDPWETASSHCCPKGSAPGGVLGL